MILHNMYNLPEPRLGSAIPNKIQPNLCQSFTAQESSATRCDTDMVRLSAAFCISSSFVYNTLEHYGMACGYVGMWIRLISVCSCR